ncbi:MAG: Hpt domain-containing protein [Anaerovorax sp.]
MTEMIEKLKEYGGDVTGIKDRFLNDMDLYKKCLVVFLEDPSFEKLSEALLETDYAKAFEYAHTLKGVAGNMGLTPIYQVICNMVEALRKNEYSGLQDDYQELMYQLEKVRELAEA